MRSFTSLRKVVFTSLLLALISVLFMHQAAIAAPVAYPNPRPDAAITEGYVFSFTDLAFAEGGNPAGTVLVLEVTEYDGATPSNWSVADVWIKATNDEEVFTWDSIDPDLTITWIRDDVIFGPATYTGGLIRNRNYLWRVNVDGALGTSWRVDMPISQPSDEADLVGTRARFHWDSHPDFPSATMEYLYLVDWDEGDPNYEKGWVLVNNQGEVTGFNTARLVKTVDLTTTGRSALREWWYPDTGWFELLPGRTYRMRIAYGDEDGPYEIVDGEGGHISYYWADLQSDFYEGWEFYTVEEIGGASLSSEDVESTIIYWQSQWGTKHRYQDEGDTSFLTTADRLAAIHLNDHHPSVNTIFLGTEAISASYGGLHNDDSWRARCTAQAEWAPEITEWTGWYTYSADGRANHGFSGDAQARYNEPVARSMRTFLEDAANSRAFGGNDDRADMENLAYIILLGDAERVPPSYYYEQWGAFYNWVPTDFFYSSQDGTNNINTTPHYQVSRIPIRKKTYRTVMQDGTTTYNPELPVMAKIRDYATLLNSEAKKTQAYSQWFGRAVVVSASSEYDRWYPFYSAFSQYFVSQRLPIGGGLLRDVFSGLLVRKYDIFSHGDEALTPANILRHISNPTDPYDVPGFLYLIGRGQWIDLPYSTMGDEVYIAPDEVLTSSQFTDTYEIDPTDGRRALLVSPSSLIGRYDISIWESIPTLYSIGEEAVLAPGGPIGLVGFTSPGDYDTSVTYDREYTHAATGEPFDYSMTYFGAGPDEAEGYCWPSINQGVLSLEPDGVPEDGVAGKIELIRQFAIEYAATSQAGLGNIYNHALAEYITNNLDEFVANDTTEQRVASAVFGATLLGDCALVLPYREPAAKDNTRPDLTDTNPRPATAVVGYSPTPRYNSQNMPVHTIPQAAAGTNITLNIETDADHVRVRVLTPFRQNVSYIPGYWYNTSGEHWIYSDPNTDGDGDPETCTTIDSECDYTFTTMIPSVYIIIVQAENPAWIEFQDPEEYRWLQERWIYVQTVNEFVRDPDANIVVVDLDQHDRYSLHAEHYTHVENYYVNPAMDGLGYTLGEDPLTYPNKPALPLVNKNTGEDLLQEATHKYQYWCTNAYSTLDPNGDDILAGRRYYGEITPAMLKSIQDSRGVVLWFSGDNGSDFGDGSFRFPQGYWFSHEDVEVDETLFLQNFVARGGRLWITSQSLLNSPLWAEPLLRDTLGSIPQTLDTDYTGMTGLQDGTLSTFINDVNIEGGDGASNADLTGEIDPTGIEAATIFFWDPASGPGTVTGTGTAAMQNRHVTLGGRTIFFPWPFEAIDHIGNLGPDNSGRESVLFEVISWLRNVPKPTPVNPLDGATGVSRAIILQWSRVPEASFYRVYIGLDPANLTDPGTIVDTDNPWFDPAEPTNPLNPLLDPDTQYYWRVDCLNDDYATVTTGDVWSFTTVTRAPKASDPNPLHMADQIPVAPALLDALGIFSWINLGTADTYDVYMWNEDDGDHTLDPTTNPALLVAQDLTEGSYLPIANLVADRQYYWRVDSYNELSPDPDPLDPNDPGLDYGPTIGDVWQFHTITVPPKPTEPNPTDGAVNVATTKLLSWKATDRTDSYLVFLWTGDPGSPPALPTGEVLVDWDNLLPRYEYDAGNLSTSTIYYWMVQPVNAAGTQTAVDTWTFTTSNIQSPDRVTGLIPENGEGSVPVDVILSWDPALGAESYIIYLGADSPPASPVASDVELTEYDPPEDLEDATTYYWRVDSVAADGATSTAGEWQTFTTVNLDYPAASNPSPADGETGVLFIDEGVINFTWEDVAPEYDFYIGPDPDNMVLQTESPFDYNWQEGTRYYWRVDNRYDDGLGGEILVPGPLWFFITEGTGGGGGGGGSSCFIVTSAYAASDVTLGVAEMNCTGDYVLTADRAEKLNDIRALRDSLLLNHSAGRDFSAWYYAVGPYAAQAVRHNEPAKAAIRTMLLNPLAEISRSCLEEDK